MVRSIAGWVLGALLIAAGIAYLGDSLYIRHKVAGANSAAALGNVRFYYATKLKNGKLNIYQDSPQTEVCVHALFPHYGYKPMLVCEPEHGASRGRSGEDRGYRFFP